MTTIAANRKVIACESRISCGDTMFDTDDKIKIIGESLIGYAGTVSAAAKFLKWFKDGGDFPEFGDDSFGAIVINTQGLWHYETACHGTKIAQPFYSEGTGSMAAMAAMYCGLDPAEAVAVAIKCDKNSGGKIHVYDFNGGKPAKRK